MTTSTLTQEQQLHYMAWRATALELMPYMADYIFSFRPVACDEVDTFAVDKGMRLYMNFDNIIPKGPRFAGEGLLHEVGHVAGEHDMLSELAGVTPEERDAWNIAGDCAINDDLRDAGCALLAAHGMFGASIGSVDYLTPLDYMEVLRRRMAGRKPKQGQKPGGQGSSGQGSGQSGNQPGQGAGQPGQGVPQKGCGSGAGGKGGSYELPDSALGGQADAASGIEKELIKISTAANIRKHQAQHGIGSVPGGFAQILDEVLEESRTPWEQQLASFIRRCVAITSGNYDLSYQRRNRRRLNEKLRDSEGRIVGRVIAPGYIKPVPSVHFYRDTSGSVSDHNLALATTEVLGVSRRLGIRGEQLIVTDVDVTVYESKRFTGVDSIKGVSGRGGTDMRNAIRKSVEGRKKPSVIIIATDGETPWPAERPTVPVVVLLVNASDRGRARVPEWAKLVEVNDV